MCRDKTEFYDRVSGIDPDRKNIVYTVLDGEAAYEKGLSSDGTLVWTSGEQGFLSAHQDILNGIQVTGVHMVDGCRVYAEILGHEKKLVICGAGHVSMPVIRIGLMIGFSVTVIDDREAFTENARAAGAEVVCDGFEHALANIPGSPDTYYVIVTRGHHWDRECLRAIAGKPHAYIGLMGSRRRVGMVLQGLREEGVPAEVLDRVHTPIGLSIGAETPEEIAVSIMAEIIEVKNRDNGCFGYSKEMLKEILEPHGSLVMTTITGRKGSAPRAVSTKMLVPETGKCIGTIGGGLAEAIIMEDARRMIRDGQREPKILYVDLTMETAEEEGMVCGGTIEVLMEPIYTTPREEACAEVLTEGESRVADEKAAPPLKDDGPFTAAVITLSDRAYAGTYEDKSGPLMAGILREQGYEVIEELLLPDDKSRLKRELIRLADRRQVNVIFTTGGTGFAERDITPEATLEVCDRQAPGIAEAMRWYSLQITPKAMLSRQASGIRKKTLIVNMPGSPKAVKEDLDFILKPLEHGLGILRGTDTN